MELSDGYYCVPETGLIDRCFSEDLLHTTYGHWEIMALKKVKKTDQFYSPFAIERLPKLNFR